MFGASRSDITRPIIKKYDIIENVPNTNSLSLFNEYLIPFEIFEKLIARNSNLKKTN